MAPPNLKSKDYYDILGCKRGDDDATLKKAYRKLAVKVSMTIKGNDFVLILSLSILETSHSRWPLILCMSTVASG
jgi:hypothetical protein